MASSMKRNKKRQEKQEENQKKECAKVIVKHLQVCGVSRLPYDTAEDVCRQIANTTFSNNFSDEQMQAIISLAKEKLTRPL